MTQIADGKLGVQAYCGTASQSAWFSDDAGETWVHPNSHSGMYIEQRVWAIASHSQTPDRMFAGTDDGIFRWDEETLRWMQLPSPMTDVWAVALDLKNPDLLLAGTRPGGFFRSVDAGKTWKDVTPPGVIPKSTVNAGPTRVTQILFDPIDDGTVWAAIEIGGVYRSKDRGLTWEYKNKGLVSGDVHGLAIVKPPGGNKILFVTTNMGLHRSEDNGETFFVQSLPSPWPYTRGITPRADNTGVIFVGNGNGPPGNDGFLLRSRDYGKTWEDAKLADSLDSTVWCIAAHAADPKLLFVCTNLGELFRSTDGGESWKRMPHVFGDMRTLHWRSVPEGTRKATHSLTRPVLKAKQMGWTAT